MKKRNKLEKIEFGKFYCGHCGKQGTITQSINCDCEKHKKGNRWMDSQELWEIKSNRDNDYLTKIPNKV